jgi:hypothetical protein
MLGMCFLFLNWFFVFESVFRFWFVIWSFLMLLFFVPWYCSLCLKLSFVLEPGLRFGSVVFNMVVFVFVLCCSKLCFPCSWLCSLFSKLLLLFGCVVIPSSVCSLLLFLFFVDVLGVRVCFLTWRAHQ